VIRSGHGAVCSCPCAEACAGPLRPPVNKAPGSRTFSVPNKSQYAERFEEHRVTLRAGMFLEPFTDEPAVAVLDDALGNLHLMPGQTRHDQRTGRKQNQGADQGVTEHRS